MGVAFRLLSRRQARRSAIWTRRAESIGIEGTFQNAISPLWPANSRELKLFQFVEQKNAAQFWSASTNQASRLIVAAVSFDLHYVGRDRCSDASPSLMS